MGSPRRPPKRVVWRVSCAIIGRQSSPTAVGDRQNAVQDLLHKAARDQGLRPRQFAGSVKRVTLGLATLRLVLPMILLLAVLLLVITVVIPRWPSLWQRVESLLPPEDASEGDPIPTRPMPTWVVTLVPTEPFPVATPTSLLRPSWTPRSETPVTTVTVTDAVAPTMTSPAPPAESSATSVPTVELTETVTATEVITP